MMRQSTRSALFIAGVYVGVSVVWIVVSDSIAAMFPAPVQPVISTTKGLFFVAVTGFLLYGLTLRAFGNIERETAHAQSAERTLDIALDLMPVGVLVVGPDERVVAANPAAERVLAVSASALTGRPLAAAFGYEDPADMSSIAELLRTGALDGIEVHADGESRALIGRASQIHSDGGQPDGWIVVVADVTQAHHDEMRVHRLARGYRFLASAVAGIAKEDSVSDIMCTVCDHAVERGGFSAAWAVHSESPGGQRQYEWSGMDERLAKGLDPFAYDRDMLASEFERLRHGEVVVKHIDDSRIQEWRDFAADAGFAVRAAMLAEDSFGAAVGFIFFSDDPDFFDSEHVAMLATLRSSLAFAFEKRALDRRRLDAEEALQASEEGYRLLFERNPQPMWVYDRETLMFLAVNDSATVKYGFSRDEFLGMQITQIRPSSEVPQLIAHSRAPRPDMSDSGVWTHQDKSGRTFPVQVYAHDIEWSGRQARLVQPIEVAQF